MNIAPETLDALKSRIEQSRHNSVMISELHAIEVSMLKQLLELKTQTIEHMKDHIASLERIIKVLEK